MARVRIELPDDSRLCHRIMHRLQSAGYGTRRVRIVATGRGFVLITGGLPRAEPSRDARRQAARDAAYREALGVGEGAELPAAVGVTGGSRGGPGSRRLRR